MCESSAKILNYRIVGARQSIEFFRQNTWFLENNRALPKFFYGILHYVISIIKRLTTLNDLYDATCMNQLV